VTWCSPRPAAKGEEMKQSIREKVRVGVGACLWGVGFAVIFLAVAVSPTTAGTVRAPVTVTGLIWGIDQGDVKPAGKESLQEVQVARGVTIPLVISASGRYVVLERHVTGVVTSGPGTGAPFTLTYHANVPLLTQAGHVQAFVVGSGFEINTHFESQFGGPCTSLLDPIIGFLGAMAGVPPTAICDGSVFKGIYVAGAGTFVSGPNGNGVFQAWLIPVLDPATGHILAGFGAIQFDTE